MKERLKKHFNTLTEEEKLNYCKKQLATVISNFKKKEKAVKAEFEYNGDRKGIRGGKFTSLSSNAVTNTQMYFSSLEDLKTIIELI